MTVNRVELRLPNRLAQGVDLGMLPGGQQGDELAFSQAGPRFEVLGRAVKIKPAQGRGRVPRDGGQRDQRNQQRGRIKLPKQASSSHGCCLISLAYP